jgi:kynureninase
MHDELLKRRMDYPILDTCTYLVSNSLGAMHRGSREGLSSYADLWAGQGVVAWREWFPAMTRIADLVGAVLGAEPGTTLLRANVADALTAVASALPVDSPRRRVVCSAGDWPGTHYFWTEWARRHGGEIVVVPLAADGITVDADRIAAAVDDRTLAVSVSVVQFRTAALLDLEPVVAAAGRHGALLIADAYQAAGAVPVRVAELGVDVCIGGSVKWLCGGPGNGWLSVRRDLADQLAPASVGWISHARPFDFDFDAIDYAAGIGRFAGGTPNVPAAFAAQAGYAAVADIGVDAIRERSMSLTQPIVDAAVEHGWTVNSPIEATRRGGHVTVDPYRGDRAAGQGLTQALIDRGVVVDFRPGSGVRIAPHFYNDVEEGLHAIDVIADIVAGM